MEGLIPMVFKAIKKNRVRSHYRCLSNGAAQSYNIADFYQFDDDHDHNRGREFYTPQTETRGGFEGRRNGHQRYASTGGYALKGELQMKDDYEANGGFGRYPSPPPNMQLKRFSSHRMFSCITGAT